MRASVVCYMVLLGLSLAATRGRAANMNPAGVPTAPVATGEETVTLGGGCFWCLEAIFTSLKGVHNVESGFSGGHALKPTYQEVCAGTTGHAEVVQLTFDPKILPLHDLLSIFFTVHDPTTLNRQGVDNGTQYRSVIFYRTPEQKAMADAVMKEVLAARIWDGPLVTQLVPFEAFYQAEAHHQDYFERNPNQPYCRTVIEPKVRKFRDRFKDRLIQP